jgi:AcrR family transcriptional regulator
MNHSMHQASPDLSLSCEKRQSRRERHRAQTRQRIIEHALRLFSERGVQATTVEDITNAADIGKGTFFNYFATKEHVLADLCRLQMGKIRELVAKAMLSTKPMNRVMHEIAVTLNENFARDPGLVLSLLVPSFSSEAMRQQMADHLSEDRLVLAELMAARQKRGELRDDFTPTELALQFQRAFFGTTVLWSLDPSKPLSDCLQEMANALWAGIRNQTESCSAAH